MDFLRSLSGRGAANLETHEESHNRARPETATKRRANPARKWIWPKCVETSHRSWLRGQGMALAVVDEALKASSLRSSICSKCPVCIPRRRQLKAAREDSLAHRLLKHFRPNRWYRTTTMTETGNCAVLSRRCERRISSEPRRIGSEKRADEAETSATDDAQSGGHLRFLICLGVGRAACLA